MITTAELLPFLDALDRGVVRVRDGRVTAANGAFARMAGLPASELVGRSVAELFSDPEERPLVALEAGDGLRLRALAGRRRSVSLRPATDELWLVLDREREARLEREIWRLASERAEVALPVDDPLVGERVGMVEHEIRTAITVVRGYLRWIGGEHDRLLGPEHWSWVREARRAAERVGPLLDNLLELANNGDPFTNIAKPIRLHDVIRDAVATARPLLVDRGIQVELALAAEPDALLGDPERLRQVFVNLLVNACTWGPPASLVRIETDIAELDGGRALQAAISDAGPGIAAADAERIFKPFVQGHRTPGVASGGVGLGLAICRRIAAAHRGRVEVVSELGHGLFRVTLPGLDEVLREDE